MAMPSAQAQWAVIDVASIQQLVVQIEYWKQQIEGMQSQLDQLKQTHCGADRRSRHAVAAADERCRAQLPARGLGGNAQGAGGHERSYGGLSAAVASAIDARKVLSDARLAALGAAERDSRAQGATVGVRGGGDGATARTPMRGSALRRCSRW